VDDIRSIGDMQVSALSKSVYFALLSLGQGRVRILTREDSVCAWESVRGWLQLTTAADRTIDFYGSGKGILGGPSNRRDRRSPNSAKSLAAAEAHRNQVRRAARPRLPIADPSHITEPSLGTLFGRQTEIDNLNHLHPSIRPGGDMSA